jgi:AcrR family transcriptional regulator
MTDPRTPARRPRDRKERILAAAIECFYQRGYHATGMEEIAAAVGITAAALYRHYPNKQELLSRAVLDGLVELRQATARVHNLDGLLRVHASFTMDHRHSAVLWEREARHLSVEQRKEARRLQRVLVGRVAAAVSTARPELSTADADFIAWAAIAAVASPSYHKVELPRARFEELLRECGAAACTTAWLPRPTPPEPGGNHRAAGLARASRREALLAAAIRLFGERGYAAVSMEEIGAAAGVTGPSVYNHFAGKIDLLRAALHRGTEALQFELSRALAVSSRPEQALELVLRSYATSALVSAGAVALLVAELPSLPEDERRSARRSQHDYLAEWVALLMACRPELAEAQAWVVVHAALTVVNALSRLPHLQRRPGLADDIIGVGLDVLGIAPAEITTRPAIRSA